MTTTHHPQQQQQLLQHATVPSRLPPHFRPVKLQQPQQLHPHHLQQLQHQPSLRSSIGLRVEPAAAAAGAAASDQPASIDPASHLILSSPRAKRPDVYESFVALPTGTGTRAQPGTRPHGAWTQPRPKTAQSQARRLVPPQRDGRGDEEEEYEGVREEEGGGEQGQGDGVMSILFGGCFSACQRMSLSEHGLGIYMASPSELEKYTVCAELADQASESMGELFVPKDVEDTNGGANGASGGGAGSFLKGIFSGSGATPRGAGPADLDAILMDKPGPSGTGGSVAMRTVGRTIPGPARIDRAAAGSVSAGQAAAMALQNLNERSEKLNATVDATENLKNSAQTMASRSAKLVEKMEKKKWYNF